MVFSQLEEGVTACCERIRQCVTACSTAELQADPRLREELKTAEAKIGLQAQMELLQLVKSLYVTLNSCYVRRGVGPQLRCL